MENQNNNNSSNFDISNFKSLDAATLAKYREAVAKARAERASKREVAVSKGRSPEREAYLANYRRGVEERKVERAAKRAVKEEERANFVPHIGKILKAAASLPELSEDATEVLQMFQALSVADRAELAAHVNHTIREAQTLMSLTVSLRKGMVVQVTGGDPRFIGMIGELTDVRRIRSFVKVPGMDKQLYVFSADVTPVVEEKVVEDVFDTTLEDDRARGLI